MWLADDAGGRCSCRDGRGQDPPRELRGPTGDALASTPRCRPLNRHRRRARGGPLAPRRRRPSDTHGDRPRDREFASSITIANSDDRNTDCTTLANSGDRNPDGITNSPPVAIATPTAAPSAPLATPTPAASPTAQRPPPQRDSLLAVIVPSPRGVVFREVGESATLEVRGLYSDGAERVLPDGPGAAVAFSSSDPGVADVDAQGRITSLAPGGVDIFVEYGGVRAEVPVIVYGPYVHVPPYDPQRVVEVAPGVEVVVNRLILRPAGPEYDSSLAHQIAADYGGRITAEWLNLRAFGLEFPIEGLDELEELLLKLSADPRITGLELDSLYTAADYHYTHDTPAYAYDLAGFSAASQLLANAPELVVVNIAVIDTQLSLEHQDLLMQKLIFSAFGHLMGANASSRIFTTPLELLPGAMPLPGAIPWQIPGSSHGLAVASVIASRDGGLEHGRCLEHGWQGHHRRTPVQLALLQGERDRPG